ncbi:hypothetical protein JI435_145140 [Parastagonospora nodorum SN15]|uniref:Homologous-pairing protein 2 winged helix domain-containing protein n=1 Tax=Phaeosphaeria nodorum (strain SN15 / ATCC MYA-4574 / FGSC 10173) TaxID=321614 RepID=A0A7U2I6Y2_PHANO|nr:hypothetical protein JI435_145140 [Parastagonospora nodorum SN15]
MAPRKKTEEKASANEAADMVLHYLRKQNRPYSAIDVSANLHNKVTKAAAAKVLKDLHEQKQIEGRPAGKQIVYHAIQDPSDSCTPSNSPPSTPSPPTCATKPCTSPAPPRPYAPPCHHSIRRSAPWTSCPACTRSRPRRRRSWRACRA